MVFVSAETAGWTHWRARYGDVEVCFAGKGPRNDREAVVRQLAPPETEVAWLTQVHSAKVVEADAGENGRGDALVTYSQQRALTVVTADCVPVLLAGPRQIAAVHAGWRGLAGSILAATLGRFETPCEVTAWIGPAIGPCCYEVGDEVADRVRQATSSSEIVAAGPHGRPHLDLAAAARIQLEQLGARTTHSVDICTRCDSEHLWSYRREGSRAGRNVSMIWRS